jgi:hypothetical protein
MPNKKNNISALNDEKRLLVLQQLAKMADKDPAAAEIYKFITEKEDLTGQPLYTVSPTAARNDERFMCQHAKDQPYIVNAEVMKDKFWSTKAAKSLINKVLQDEFGGNTLSVTSQRIPSSFIDAQRENPKSRKRIALDKKGNGPTFFAG